MTAEPLSVFVHAVGFTGASLSPVASRVGGTAVCLDIVGHGDAHAPAGHVFSWRDAAERLLPQIRAAGATSGRRFGFGHSGGGAALLWCEVLEPGTFDALFLYEPPLRLLRPEAFASSASNLTERVGRRRNSFGDPGEFEVYLRERAPYRGFSDEALAAYIASGLRKRGDEYALACAPEFEAGIYATPETNLLEHLDQIALPVVVAHGEGTDERFAQVGVTLAERLPRGRLVIVPGLDHFGPLQSPEVLAEVFDREIVRTLAVD